MLTQTKDACGSSERQPKAKEDLIENQRDAAVGAHLAKPLQPFCITCAVITGVWAAVHQR